MGYEYGIFHKRKIYEKQLYLFHLYRLGVNLGLVSLKFFLVLILLYVRYAIKTLINRAYNISSTDIDFNNEFLKTFFQSNGYPLSLFHKYLKLFLTNTHEPVTTVSK